MTAALALSAVLSLPAMQAQPSRTAFHPQFHVRFQPAISPLPRRDGDREIICGMVVIHKTPASDPKIVLPPRDTGAAVRRIEPRSCAAKPLVTAK